MAHQLVAPYKGSPYRIGYFSDNEVGWWYGALFIYYLKQPAANHTKQKLLVLLQETYDNDWQRFLQDFVPPRGVASFAALLDQRDEMTGSGLVARAFRWCAAGRACWQSITIVSCMAPYVRQILSPHLC